MGTLLTSIKGNAMSVFHPWVMPLNKTTTEATGNGWKIEYEFFDCQGDMFACLAYTLFQENWHQIGLGHIEQGSVFELEFHEAPKKCVLYDGYLTVIAQDWHIHLCIEETLGGPNSETPPELRQHRLINTAAFYRRINSEGEPRSWGIQFWNGAGEKGMTIFLPNPYIDDDNLLPDGKANFAKLEFYHELREMYVLGTKELPFTKNPFKCSYIAVCTSGRCYPSQKWQPTFDALKVAVEKAKLDIEVRTSGCLQVCKSGPVVFYSEDKTWYYRVKPEVAERIVNEHLEQGKKVKKYLYPPV
jgi:(2Fe-2S) ferredoxin